MAIFLMTPNEIMENIAKQAQEKRLSLNFSQKTLADRSGISLGTLKKFERTGKISIESILKIALVLGCLQEFNDLFKAVPYQKFNSLDEILKDKKRKRGRE